jgi:hypothetical protein
MQAGTGRGWGDVTFFLPLEVLEVADQEVAGEFVVLELGKVVEGLLFGSLKVSAGALLLDEQHAFPE